MTKISVWLCLAILPPEPKGEAAKGGGCVPAPNRLPLRARPCLSQAIEAGLGRNTCSGIPPYLLRCTPYFPAIHERG